MNQTERRMLAVCVAVLMAMACLVVFTGTADGHRGAWASHSTYQGGGRPDARTFRGCERINRQRPRFLKHRCKHKVYWDRKYRELPDHAKRTLYARRHCESNGRSPDHDPSWTYHSEYQYDEGTADAAGFTLHVHSVYFRELDVRTWWFTLSSGYDPWPRCP